MTMKNLKKKKDASYGSSLQINLHFKLLGLYLGIYIRKLGEFLCPESLMMVNTCVEHLE